MNDEDNNGNNKEINIIDDVDNNPKVFKLLILIAVMKTWFKTSFFSSGIWKMPWEHHYL